MWEPRYGPCPDGQRVKAALLARTVLQPIRDRFGRLERLCGYRSPEHNATVGGVSTSSHLWAGENCAVDFTPTSGDRLGIIEWTLKLLPWAWGELEYSATTTHLHLTLPTGKDQGQLLFIHKPRKVSVEVPWRADPARAIRDIRALIAQYPA
jgi:hypothetical protein